MAQRSPQSRHSHSRAAAPPRPRAPAAPIPSPQEIFDPVGRALDTIGDRWTLVLLHQLGLGPKGFQELRKRTGITPRVLSSRLRQLVGDGLVEAVSEGTRSHYEVTERGRSLEPIVSALGRWWIQHGIQDLGVDLERFTETSPHSVLESLPLMLREDRARDADVTFEIRLTGEGGGSWTVRIENGSCEVRPGFATRPDVRYTADSSIWCGLALGLLDARDLVRSGKLAKEGSRDAMDHYFHQMRTPEARKGASSNRADEMGQTKKTSKEIER